MRRVVVALAMPHGMEIARTRLFLITRSSIAGAAAVMVLMPVSSTSTASVAYTIRAEGSGRSLHHLTK